MDKDIFSIEEVAGMLQCESSTIEEKARALVLPGVKMGRSWVFPRVALLQRLNELALAKPAPPQREPPRPGKPRQSRAGPPGLPSLN